MSQTVFSKHVKKPRTAKPCTWCGQTCEPGQPRDTYGWKDDGKTLNVETMHPECYEAMGDMAAQEGGFFLWSAGDFNRGCCCENGRCECSN